MPGRAVRRAATFGRRLRRADWSAANYTGKASRSDRGRGMFVVSPCVIRAAGLSVYNEGMLRRLLLLPLAGVLISLAQQPLSYDQLRDIVRSSISQGLTDKEVSKYLRQQKLNFALTEPLMEEFVGWGIGPRTLNVLRELKPGTEGLPAPNVAKPAGPLRRGPPPPPEQEQRRIIEEARRNALEYTAGLPDFVCLQITRRFVDPSGLEMDWLKYDEIKTRVSYFEHHENYEVMSVNNKVTSRTMLELGGAISTGEFGSMLAEVFLPSTEAEFRWARHSLLRGHGVYVFHLYVPRRRSRWQISFQGERKLIAGYRGLVYIDKESERVLRVVTRADDMPADFPIQEAQQRLDYDLTDISGRQFLLPLKAQMRMRRGRTLTRNNTEFRLYRKFSAEATITFDEIEDLEPLSEEEEPSAEP